MAAPLLAHSPAWIKRSVTTPSNGARTLARASLSFACITRARLGISVPNGHFLVQEAADAVTSREGGAGAVREICDWLLLSQDTFDEVIQPFVP